MAKLIPATLIATLAIGISATVMPAAALSLPTSCNDAANEIIWCGVATTQQLNTDYKNGDGHNTAASIQNVYSYFGISAADIAGMNSTAVAGTVTKSGDVIVNGKTVATGAITAGRDYISGSTKVTYNGTTFYKRPTSVSFLNNSLDAFVVMSGGRFQFAVLSSCGNTVVATPVPTPAPKPQVTPNYAIEKEVAVAGSNNYQANVKVHPNTSVDFKVVVNSTGSGPVDGLVVKDTMPSDLTYTSNTLTVNGQKESATQASAFFNGGLTLSELQPKATDTIVYAATVVGKQNQNCTNQTLENVASMHATNLPNKSASATVSVVCVPSAPTTPSTPSTPATTTTTTPSTPEQQSAPQQTSQLVNTGPGSTIGIFAAVSVAGGVGFSVFQRRRASRI